MPLRFYRKKNDDIILSKSHFDHDVENYEIILYNKKYETLYNRNMKGKFKNIRIYFKY